MYMCMYMYMCDMCEKLVSSVNEATHRSSYVRLGAGCTRSSSEQEAETRPFVLFTWVLAAF